MDWLFTYGGGFILAILAELFLLFLSWKVGYAMGKEDLETLTGGQFNEPGHN